MKLLFSIPLVKLGDYWLFRNSCPKSVKNIKEKGVAKLIKKRYLVKFIVDKS